MHDAAAVRGRKGGGNVSQHTFGDIDWERARCGEPIRHAATGHMLHDEVWRAIRQLAHAIDRDDVGVRHRGNGLGFPLKARVCLFVGPEGLEQHLYRDEALELRVAPEVDATHAPFADGTNKEHATAEYFLKSNGDGVVLQRRNRSAIVRLARCAGEARHCRYDTGFAGSCR